MAWTQYVGTNSKLLPDFQGGLTFATNSSVSRLDGLTGIPSVLYSLAQPHPPSGTPSTVVHTDGTVFTVDGDSVAVVNPASGTQTLIPMTHSTFSFTSSVGGCQGSSTDEPPITGDLMIAGDGYAYLVYQYRVESGTSSPSPALATPATNCSFGIDSTNHFEVHERLLRVGTDGSSMSISVGDWTQDDSGTYTSISYDANQALVSYEVVVTQAGIIPNRVEPILITNSDQGVLLSLNAYVPGYIAYDDAVFTSTIVCPNNLPSCGYQVTAETQNIVQGPPPVNLLTVTGGSITSNVTLPRLITYVEPDLQAQDGTFFGIVDYDWSGDDFLASFDKSGNVKWSNLGYYAQIATSDGGVIGQSYSGQSYTFDANGNSTGQLATLNPPSSGGSSGQWPGWLTNQLGFSYFVGSGAATALASTPIIYAPTFAALPGGNSSTQGTAIQQVQTNQAQGNQRQLPDLSLPIFCVPAPAGLSMPLPLTPTCGNINAIELLTKQSPDSIFKQFIQTFAPVTANGQNGEMIVSAGNAQQVNVTGSGQKLLITLVGWKGILQAPFGVLTERFDPVNHVISAVTLEGHPLAGWRYWRVYSIGTNDVVIETGAYDQPGPAFGNYSGFYIAKGDISLGWRQYMQYIQNKLHAPQGPNLRNSLGGIPLRTYPWGNPNLLEGYWDYPGEFTNYILNNVCQSTFCN